MDAVALLALMINLSIQNARSQIARKEHERRDKNRCRGRTSSSCSTEILNGFKVLRLQSHMYKDCDAVKSDCISNLRDAAIEKQTLNFGGRKQATAGTICKPHITVHKTYELKSN